MMNMIFDTIIYLLSFKIEKKAYRCNSSQNSNPLKNQKPFKSFNLKGFSGIFGMAGFVPFPLSLYILIDHKI
jgi:hypothetical protein